MSAEKGFLERTMVPNASTKVDTRGASGKRVNKETLSPFDTTIYRGTARPGQHPDLRVVAPSEESAFSLHLSTRKASPREFLRRGEGLGGSANAAAAADAAAKKVAAAAALRPPATSAIAKRPNPPNTELRRYYERCDLPCAIAMGAAPSLSWRVPVATLDLFHYLPLFCSGLREEEEPYRFLGEAGTLGLIAASGEAKVLPVLPQLILPLKDAVATRDERVLVRVLGVLSALADLGPRVGAALVPYYRQLLPVLNAFMGRIKSLGDGIDYGQRFGVLGERINDCLAKLEANGGPDALVNLQYCLPRYESCFQT